MSMIKTSNNKIAPKVYGYILIFFGFILNNFAEALPIVTKRDDDVESSQNITQKIIGIITAFTGFCICFFGYKLYDRIIFFIGFATGVFFTKSVFSSLFNEPSALIFYITAFIVGMIFGGIAVCAYKVSLCILGVLAGYGASAIFITLVPSIADKINPLIITAIFAIIFVILVFIYEIPIIIISTSIAGSYMLFYGIDTIINTGFAYALQTMYNSISFQSFESSLSVNGMVIGSLIVAILGCAVQFISYRNNKSEY